MGKEGRAWRRWLRGLADEFAADEWEKVTARSGEHPLDGHGGAQASLDEVLREAKGRERAREGVQSQDGKTRHRGN